MIELPQLSCPAGVRNAGDTTAKNPSGIVRTDAPVPFMECINSKYSLRRNAREPLKNSLGGPWIDRLAVVSVAWACSNG